jgi:hypothetical protein
MTPTQEDREAADSGFTPENIADAEWLWTNMAVDHRKFHTLPTHHKALLCHTAQRFRLAAEERGARMEREQIVAWLRRQERLALERLDAADNPNSERNYAAGAAAVQMAADIIERGEHRQIEPGDERRVLTLELSIAKQLPDDAWWRLKPGLIGLKRLMPNVMVEPQIALITHEINQAVEAQASGDVVAMLRAYEAIKDYRP